MRPSAGKLAVMLAVSLALLAITVANKEIVFCESTGGKIDLFTDKEPYSGKGPSAPSDAFGFGEDITIFALVKYNGYPVQGVLVAFQIVGPIDPVENISFVRTAATNGAGIAEISFRLDSHDQSAADEWVALGNVRLGESTFQDYLTFRVGWIVEIVSMRTINENYTYQGSFMRGSQAGVEITLQTISMTEKLATLTVTIYDNMNNIVNATTMTDFTVEPNETLVYAHVFLFIPRTAQLGTATIYASACTNPVNLNGTACYPEISTQFIILEGNFTLNVLAADGGTTSPAPGSYSFLSGTTVQVMAISNDDYAFDHWELDSVDVGSGNPYLVLMDKDHTLKAVFTPTTARTFVPFWLYWIPWLLLALVAILLIILLYRRKRKKNKSSAAFSSGWTAWYYHYDLRNKEAFKPRSLK